MDGKKNESKTSFECRHCGKGFRKESTLTAHLCEPKRRVQQEKETGVQWGLRAYLKFYETTQGSARLKSYEDFSTSPYYNAFVKFGRYCVSVRCINFENFTVWLLKNNKKLDQWCSDKLYDQWLVEYLRRESVQDALERGLQEMQEHADTNPDLKNGYLDYFRYSNVNRIMHHVSTGRISPWVVYNCATGIEFLDGLLEDQVAMLLPWIDPESWQRKFREYSADTEWCKHILREAGL
jgi:hypothetical protein